MPEWRCLDSDNNMVKLDVTSMDIFPRYQPEIIREPITGVVSQIYAKIALFTFDTHRLNNADHTYASSMVSMWSLEDSAKARKRDNKHLLCHRHRHMHYTFRLSGQKEDPRPKNRPCYSANFEAGPPSEMAGMDGNFP